MTEVVSIKFRNRGKTYYFDPNGQTICSGETVIVDTANGMEIAECSRGNHSVEDTAVVHPLRLVLRKATQMDLRNDELNRQREQSALVICREKIAEHGLDMKLVDVECSFEGNKTTFFFTSDGRVDFRALVKDLAAILHNRIELRQIGVRDEAKMLGGLGICGRPYCCSQFLDDFHPVSTKMAKTQSLSLNPAKISGSCGRLMCCLRYEQDAYEDLVKKVPKQGAFVETIDGYGTAVQVNLLRSTVRVRLDDDREDALHEYRSYELAAVPGGRPKDGAEPPHVLEYVEPEPEETEDSEPVDEWVAPTLLVTPVPEHHEERPAEADAERRSRRSRRNKASLKAEAAAAKNESAGHAPAAAQAPEKLAGSSGPDTPVARSQGRSRRKNSRSSGNASAAATASASPAPVASGLSHEKPIPVEVRVQTPSSGKGTDKAVSKSHKPSRRRNSHGKKKPSGNNPEG
ncbi:MAG: stage 0 sporulation family protein [Oscillospiraceae bacterium]|nr:stage 0 sporulation family protein [Oscillospiraceae bacterium]